MKPINSSLIFKISNNSKKRQKRGVEALILLIFFSPIFLHGETDFPDLKKGHCSNGLNSLFIDVSPSTYFPIPECTEIEYLITVQNNFNEPKEVTISFFALDDIHEAVEISDFTQPDPDDFFLTPLFNLGGE